MAGIMGALTGGLGAPAAGARGAGSFVRALTNADLGVAENAFVEGTFAVRGGKATAYIKYLGKPEEGIGRGLLGARNSLKTVARTEGATALRIETSSVIEKTGRLREILGRAGFGSRPNGTMWWEGGI